MDLTKEQIETVIAVLADKVRYLEIDNTCLKYEIRALKAEKEVEKEEEKEEVENE